MADARSDRLEQRRLCLVEVPIVEAGDADDATERPPDERSAGERPCLQRAQSEVIINSRRFPNDQFTRLVDALDELLNGPELQPGFTTWLRS